MSIGIKISHQPLKLNSKCILPLVMLFVTASLAADAVAYKFVMVGPALISGATLIFPITYLLGDIITEVYGYSITRKLIWFALICEIIFAGCIQFVVLFPAVANFPYQNDYHHVFDNTLWFVLSGIVADIVSNFINIYAISRWKILMKGRHFWFRSVSSTLISELIQAVIICGMAFHNLSSSKDLMRIMISAYVLEVVYSFVFVWPAWLIIYYLKKIDATDAYDYKISYNPFRID